MHMTKKKRVGSKRVRGFLALWKELCSEKSSPKNFWFSQSCPSDLNLEGATLAEPESFWESFFPANCAGVLSQCSSARRLDRLGGAGRAARARLQGVGKFR
jgi:hypothetical protein